MCCGVCAGSYEAMWRESVLFAMSARKRCGELCPIFDASLPCTGSRAAHSAEQRVATEALARAVNHEEKDCDGRPNRFRQRKMIVALTTGAFARAIGSN